MQIDNYKLIEALRGIKPLDITLTPAPEWTTEISPSKRMYKGKALDKQEVRDEHRR